MWPRNISVSCGGVGGARVNMFVSLCVCVLVACVGAHAQSSTVDIEQGRVLGVDEDGYISFYGIPFGGPTSGENRFQPPTPAKSFEGELYAANRNITCAQPTPNGIKGTEDCLVLSIHTANVTTKKPVLVWLESEDYERTPAVQRNFKTLVTEGLVVVSLNHRLSIFGFLCLEVPEAPGNVGLLDIVLGLKWIRQNIAGFGGDPSNIVLLGHGSGAALADMLTLTPVTDDLVHKAIVLSGSALAPWAVSYKNIENANALGDKMGMSNMTRELLAKGLKTVSADNILIALNELNRDELSPLFAPCVGEINDILTEDPIYILKSNSFKRIPFMTGFVKNEGTIRANEIINGTWTEEVRRNIEEFLPPDINIESNKTNVTNEIRNLYFTYYFNNPQEKEIEEVLNYVGDVFEIMPIIRSMQERIRNANFSDPKDYLFEFQYQGLNNTNSGYPEFLLSGPNHGDIINYILDIGLLHDDDEESDMSKAASMSILKHIISFAHDGVPAIDEKHEVASWPPVSHISMFQYFRMWGNFNETFGLSQERHPYKERFSVWDDIYSKYYRPHVERPIAKTEEPEIPQEHSSACGLKYGVLVAVSCICLLVNLIDLW